ncbi:enoyl-CoA hydratase/isomerase family protein [Nocardia aurantia]|uniref:1,2-epoxyphenylacetyl-CoA isomerase n=1 Tax=Nocardia aurantia TaxID=2585199 RepID=A0A7K0DJT1_9NOCA|nr:enoyl-CoA hydratase-related protein [Nocardia aurantia]MQY26066.1 1,2-epoxyphenylacetyl-CoA isomerase [Nocardia aurantia]
MPILLKRDNGIAHVTLDRPERRNALTADDFAHLRETFDEIAVTATDRAVLITGTGQGFCAGADLGGGRPAEHPTTVMRPINDAFRALHRLPQPTVAAVHGAAFGAGMSLALGCDIVIAADDALFSQIFVRRGLSPDTGSSWLLPRIVGLHTAKRLALLGDTITADQARALGIVTEVTPTAHLAETATAYARRLADGPPIALALTKRLLDAASTTGFDEALDAEAAATAINVATDDMAEAFTAFTEKRPPVFRGR